MTRVRAVARPRWAAIGAALVLVGCGSGAAGTAQLSHAVSPRAPANGLAPNASAVPSTGGQRCTEVYCVPQAVPRGPAHGSAPNASAVPSTGTQRCTEVYCVPQAVPRGAASFAAKG